MWLRGKLMIKLINISYPNIYIYIYIYYQRKHNGEKMWMFPSGFQLVWREHMSWKHPRR